MAKVTPSVLKIVAEKKAFRDLPVILKTTGQLPSGLRLKSIRIAPESVRAIGSASELNRFHQINTEPLDLGSVRSNQVAEVKLLSPSSLIQLKPDEPVRVRLIVSKR